jgi:hypothetical protein
MIQRRICVAATAACVALATSIASADGGKSTFTTNLTGYQETPVTINSPGSGEFAAKISKDGSEIQYVLSYRGLTTHVLQSHIHFGRPALTGGIVLFLCTNLTPPANVHTQKVASGEIRGALGKPHDDADEDDDE